MYLTINCVSQFQYIEKKQLGAYQILQFVTLVYLILMKVCPNLYHRMIILSVLQMRFVIPVYLLTVYSDMLHQILGMHVFNVDWWNLLFDNDYVDILLATQLILCKSKLCMKKGFPCRSLQTIFLIYNVLAAFLLMWKKSQLINIVNISVAWIHDFATQDHCLKMLQISTDNHDSNSGRSVWKRVCRLKKRKSQYSEFKNKCFFEMRLSLLRWFFIIQFQQSPLVETQTCFYCVVLSIEDIFCFLYILLIFVIKLKHQLIVQVTS